jgi:hypothetical protein
LLASVKAALAPSRGGRVGELQSSDAFNAAIRLERARVDRNEHAFSLVVFEAGRPKASADVTGLSVALLKNLKGRIRSIDEIGWFDDCRIGVLLPYTSGRGAEKFAGDIVGATGCVGMTSLPAPAGCPGSCTSQIFAASGAPTFARNKCRVRISTPARRDYILILAPAIAARCRPGSESWTLSDRCSDLLWQLHFCLSTLSFSR